MTFPKYTDWRRFYGTFATDPEKKVSDVEFEIETKDVVSSTNGIDRKPIYFTDIQFQSGGQASGWVPNTREMMERLTWTSDEFKNLASPHAFEGAPPTVIENVEKRFFNIVGRGHMTFVVPNYYPEDLEVPVLPSGIDLTLYPKEDFDMLRVSTSHGVEIPEDEQFYKQDGSIYREIESKYRSVVGMEPWDDAGLEKQKREISNWENIMVPLFDNHPLHKRHTREFYVDGGRAGDEIMIHATTRTATVNGSELKIVGERNVDVNGVKFPIDRKKFMLAPKGTATIRVEFYKQVERKIITYEMDSDYRDVKVQKTFTNLEDVGIGFHGTAGFYQWTYGKSRV